MCNTGKPASNCGTLSSCESLNIQEYQNIMVSLLQAERKKKKIKTKKKLKFYRKGWRKNDCVHGDLYGNNKIKR